MPFHFPYYTKVKIVRNTADRDTSVQPYKGLKKKEDRMYRVTSSRISRSQTVEISSLKKNGNLSGHYWTVPIADLMPADVKTFSEYKEWL